MRTLLVGRCLLLWALLCLSACTPEGFKGTDITGVDWGGDFALTSHTGKKIQSSDFRGRILVLYFGYTRCPDICAPTLARLTQVMTQLGSDAERVQVLFITVDPRHDRPAQLAAFVPKFHPAFLGLTGTDAEIAAVAHDHRIVYQRDATQPEQVPHSGVLLVKDGKGKLRLLFRNEASADEITHDLRRLLAQG